MSSLYPTVNAKQNLKVLISSCHFGLMFIQSHGMYTKCSINPVNYEITYNYIVPHANISW